MLASSNKLWPPFGVNFACAGTAVARLWPQGKYIYMEELRAIASRSPPIPRPLPAILGTVTTPLHYQVWAGQLRNHPDPEFSGYLLRGIRDGFRIGFDRSRMNMASATQNPSVIEEYLAKERLAGRIVGPLPPESCPAHISRFGVIPKNHQPGKWRLIVDFSHPKGACVNEGIERELCSLSYTSIDEAVRQVISMGRGTQLAKLDLESAYRIIPVQPDDRLLLGVKWQGQIFIDTALPFGLRSAPKVFTAFADGLMWIMLKNGVSEVIHYLDDYLFFGSPASGNVLSPSRSRPIGASGWGCQCQLTSWRALLRPSRFSASRWIRSLWNCASHKTSSAGWLQPSRSGTLRSPARSVTSYL